MRALALSTVGRHDEAIALAQRAAELDPVYQGAFANLGAVLTTAGRHLEAVAALENALAIAPGDPVILYNLAKAQADLGRYDDALTSIAQVIEKQPKDYGARGLRVSILLRADRRDVALAELKELEVQPTMSRYFLAVLYSRIGDGERILTLLEEGMQRREEDMIRLLDPKSFTGLRDHPRMVRILEQLAKK